LTPLQRFRAMRCLNSGFFATKDGLFVCPIYKTEQLSNSPRFV
jgi:hypothetical protein